MSRRALLACGAGLLCTRAARAGDETDGLLERIARARLPVRTLKGPFTQTRLIGLLAAEVRSRGTLALVRPDRLRWQLEPPDDVTFWVGPEGVAYRSAHGQARIAPTTARIAGALDDLRAVLGGDLGRLRERWVLRTVRSDAGGVELQADARGDSPGSPHTLRFALGPDLVRPTRVVLVEGARDRTTIDFGELTVNAPVDESSMRPP